MRSLTTPRRPALRRGLAGLLALAATTSTVAGAATLPAAAAPPPALHLPAPTGAHPVGTTSLHLTDHSRQDPWVPGAGARELMVSVWYPARSRDGQRARYMTPEESRLLLTGAGVTGVPPDSLSTTRTNSHRDAAPAGARHTLPLVVLSPGFTWPRSSLTAVAEELASRGYAVAGIDHTHESFGTAFPDGRVTTCAACEVPGEGEDAFGKLVVASRAADVSFVLDELTGPDPAWRGGALIDPSRIAMAGSSLGGASAIAAMLADSRVRAGINMDGMTFAEIPPGGLPGPFLLLGTRTGARPGVNPTWDRDWPLLTGWKRWLVVTGAVHASFTDYDLLTDRLGVDLGGELDGPRSVVITRRYVRAFVDLHLRGRPQPLLDGPSARYPEVGFCLPQPAAC
jgi:dienelactone hydrolase